MDFALVKTKVTGFPIAADDTANAEHSNGKYESSDLPQGPGWYAVQSIPRVGLGVRINADLFVAWVMYELWHNPAESCKHGYATMYEFSLTVPFERSALTSNEPWARRAV
jgi:hypothetical protein